SSSKHKARSRENYGLKKDSASERKSTYGATRWPSLPAICVDLCICATSDLSLTTDFCMRLPNWSPDGVTQRYMDSGELAPIMIRYPPPTAAFAPVGLAHCSAHCLRKSNRS